MAAPITIPNQRDVVHTQAATGIVAGFPQKIHKVPAGSTIRLYDTIPGRATVYRSNSPTSISDLDATDADIINSVNSLWDEEIPLSNKEALGAVTFTAETLAVVVETGVWTVEISVTSNV